MSLEEHIQKAFPYTPTSDQQTAIIGFSSFLRQSKKNTLFLLKGYAGTGKTTLIGSWLRPLQQQGFKVVLLAPTGRAAKVMSSYAKHKANTIHKRIYFAQQNKNGGIKFKLQKNKFRKAIFIVDEASMIGDELATSKLFDNGSLLQDLISYVHEGTDCKLVFVGDTAQLPPVKQELSPALQQNYLSLNFSVDVTEVELSEVLRQLKHPIREELERFEGRFTNAMTSKIALLNRITHYIVNRKGKQMRPMFVFLAAKLLGTTNERTYRAASVIELIHTATLVHDDVVDDSNKRRGFFSINALWKNKIAVLVGDYLLSKGLLLCIDHKDFDFLEIISTAVREMSEGELLQIEKARSLDIDEEVYYEVIRKKTATLIASCCALGACSVNASEVDVEKMRSFGEKIGMAFQIKDDLFDYGKRRIGKPTGIDIRERKMTLPLIHVMETCSSSERRWLKRNVKKYNTNRKKVNEIIEFVKSKGGLDYAVEKMHAFQNEANLILNTFPESDAKDSLQKLVSYVIDREF